MATLAGETMPPMTSRRSRGTPWSLVIVGAVGVAILGGFLFLRMRSQQSNADPSASASANVAELEALLASPAGSAGADSDPQKALILSKTSLPDAIEVARPMMSNTVGRLEIGRAHV